MAAGGGSRAEGPITVLYDGEAFMRHARGGIPRYLAELIGEFRADPSLGVEAVTPYRWIASRHLAELDRRYVELPLPRRVRLRVLRPLNARRLRHATATRQADIVHHSLYEPAAFHRWPGRRHVSTVHDFMLERFPKMMAADDDHPSRLAACIEASDAIICVSQTTLDDLHRFHPGLDKPAFAVPLGVASTFFDPAPAKLPPLPEKYVLFVGNRMGHKNIDLLLRTFAELAGRHQDLHLVLVGAHADFETERLRELGIDGRTVRLRVTDEQLPWIYRGAALLVYTTLWEGFGLPVVEAMASACPAVIADVSAVTEVAGDAALVFAPDDQAMLLSHVERVLADRDEADRLRRDGVERARLFTWRRTAELTASVYEQVLVT